MSNAYYEVIDNLIIQQGATFARAYPVSGVVMQGATVKAQCRATAGSPDVLIEFDTNLAADDMDLSAGTVTISVPPATSWGFDWTDGVWDAVLTAEDGTISRVARGTVLISPGVTRGS